MHNPYVGKIADLVNPYMEITVARSGQPVRGHEWIQQWITAHPGRWAKVGEHGVGLTRVNVESMGWGAGQKIIDGDMKIYARIPHPQGEPLLDALRRSGDTAHITLPALTTSDFNWTPEELAEATRVARENLFPVAAEQ